VSGHRGWDDSVRIWNKYPEVQACCKPGKDFHFFGMAMDISMVKGNKYFNNNLNTKENWLKSEIPKIAEYHNMQWGIAFNGYYDPVHFAQPIFSIDSMVTLTKKLTNIKDDNKALQKQPGNRLPLADADGNFAKGLVKISWALGITGKYTSFKN
jgi:hypothetical protein